MISMRSANLFRERIRICVRYDFVGLSNVSRVEFVCIPLRGILLFLIHWLVTTRTYIVFVLTAVMMFISHYCIFRQSLCSTVFSILSNAKKKVIWKLNIHVQLINRFRAQTWVISAWWWNVSHRMEAASCIHPLEGLLVVQIRYMYIIL